MELVNTKRYFFAGVAVALASVWFWSIATLVWKHQWWLKAHPRPTPTAYLAGVSTYGYEYPYTHPRLVIPALTPPPTPSPTPQPTVTPQPAPEPTSGPMTDDRRIYLAALGCCIDNNLGTDENEEVIRIIAIDRSDRANRGHLRVHCGKVHYISDWRTNRTSYYMSDDGWESFYVPQ